MIRKLGIIGLLGFAIFCCASSTLAVSIGAYAEGGGGSGEVDFDIPGTGDLETDTTFGGGGLMLETSPLTPGKVYSYRLQIGYEKRELDDELDAELEAEGVTLTNTFAFGGNISEWIRLWAGPQLLLGYYESETDRPILGDKVEVSFATLGIGLAAGINLGLGESVVVPLTVSVRTNGFFGRADWMGHEGDFGGYTNDYAVSVGLMFRL